MKGSVLVVMVVAGACSQGAVQRPATPTDPVAAYEACWSAFVAKAWDRFEPCYGESAVATTLGLPPIRGKAAILADHKAWGVAFPDATFAPQLTLVSGHDVFSVRWFRGTQTGVMKFPGGDVPPTGKPVSMLLLHHAQIDDAGRVAVETWAIDLGTLRYQLGLSKAPGRAPLAAGWPGAPLVLVAHDSDAERANAARLRELYGRWNKRDTTGFYALIADDVHESFNTDPEDKVGKKTIEAENAALATEFSDNRVDIDGVWAAGDYTIEHARFRGTHDSDHKVVDWPIVEIVQWKDGAVHASWPFTNSDDFKHQLGLQ